MSDGVLLESRILNDKTFDFYYFDKLDHRDYVIAEYYYLSLAELIQKRYSTPNINVLTETYSFIVVLHDSKIVGIAVWETTDKTTVKSKLIQVSPEFRRNSVFSTIREIQFNLLKSLNKKEMFAVIFKSNVNGIKAHFKVGFAIKENRGTTYIISKNLET